MTTPSKLASIQHRWPDIARDIALLSQPTSGGASFSAEDIARNYDLTEAEFTALAQVPAFIAVVRSELERVKQLGPFAGHRLRSEAMLASIQEQLYNRAQSGDMEDKQMLQFFAMLLKSVGLDAPEEKKEAPVQNNTAVNIAFNVPRLPSNRKLAHIIDQPHVHVVEQVG